MGDNSLLDSIGDGEIGSEKDQKLESAKKEMEEAREENKMLEFFDILQQDKPEDAANAKGVSSHEENEESELVSLSLGMSFKSKTKDERKIYKRDDEGMDQGLRLGLDINLDPVDHAAEALNISSTESSFGEGGKDEEPCPMWPPSKVLKTMRNVDKSEAQHDQPKKTRVCIRARCDTQTWRKYGQKMAKGNPCPRAYYRCTVSPSCPVQRCAEDISILITTYEGTHNHRLPMSATAMACTTSAAASMLQSPSLRSQHGYGLVNSAISFITNSSAPNYNPTDALNFSTNQVSKPHQFYFPNSSISTLNSHPTITLDLTATSSNSSLTHMPKYSSTSLNFSSGFSPLQSSMPPSPWSSYSGYFNSETLTHNRNHGGYLFNTGNQNQPYLGHLHQPIHTSNNNFSQRPLPDSIVAATKAISSNPKFQSVLATALTTYVGNLPLPEQWK
ncbi:unnamed protein product [Sphenostylis stenocarpa]|uniref:WRKY domain-containing protein n=1 Tax=Sphenostylis stenocarpa TaxID=92480 RepID=A0AA86V4P1_9FABA|nr:unnamed protein product [Sphenostylis stenocarpa]